MCVRVCMCVCGWMCVCVRVDVCVCGRALRETASLTMLSEPC